MTADFKTRNPNYKTHNGMDFIDSSGKCVIVAVADGVVDSCRNDVIGMDHNYNTAGNYVRIRHHNGTYTRYLHLATGSVCVSVGKSVKAGDKIGIMGDTGDSYGKHLHFDVNVNGEYTDPLPYLNGEKDFGTNNSKQPLTDKDKPVYPDLRKGDKVQITKAPLYVSSTASKKSNTITGIYYIHSDGIINGRIRITTPKGCSDCTGWVLVADCKTEVKTATVNPTPDKPDPVEPVSLKVGDKVRVRDGAMTFSGTRLANWVYGAVFDVQQVGTSASKDYIVIGIDGQVTAGMRAEDLYLA